MGRGTRVATSQSPWRCTRWRESEHGRTKDMARKQSGQREDFPKQDTPSVDREMRPPLPREPEPAIERPVQLGDERKRRPENPDASPGERAGDRHRDGRGRGPGRGAARPRRRGAGHRWQTRSRPPRRRIRSRRDGDAVSVPSLKGGARHDSRGAIHPDRVLHEIPIGGYGFSGRRHPDHVKPEKAVQLLEDVGGRLLVPMHWGTFDMNREPSGSPRKGSSRRPSAEGSRNGSAC